MLDTHSQFYGQSLFRSFGDLGCGTISVVAQEQYPSTLREFGRQ
jgi:hypothetical protein